MSGNLWSLIGKLKVALYSITHYWENPTLPVAVPQPASEFSFVCFHFLLGSDTYLAAIHPDSIIPDSGFLYIFYMDEVSLEIIGKYWIILYILET